MIAAYLTGALVLAWSLWASDEMYPMRVVEIALWPLAIVVGTIRKLARNV